MKFVASLVVALVLSPPAVRAQDCASGDTYGTAVSWHRDPADAAKEAKSSDKLVFVLHLSGELDDAGKT